MASAAPCASDVAAAHLARIAGLPELDVRVPGPRLVIHKSIAKARAMLGYDPQLGITDILDRAVAEIGVARLHAPVLAEVRSA